jgi:hypothetical protein
MKSTRLGFSSILCVLLLGAPNGWTQEKEVSDQSAAPIGTYAPAQTPVIRDPLSSLPTNSVPLFTLRLETNGTYFAQTAAHLRPMQDGDLIRLRPHSEVASGTWRWDGPKREFRLEPGQFVFYIKCLSVDKQHTNRLVWGNSWLVREENK